MIEKKRFIPKYYQLQRALQRMVEKKALKAGDLMPSENELVEEYNVSKSTIRQALTNLVNEGFLSREQGKGTYVSNPISGRHGMGMSKQIGLIVPDITHYFFPRVIRGIEDEAHDKNYHIILCNNDNDVEKSIFYIQRFVRENNVIGLIVAPVQSNSYLDDNLKIIKELNESELPFVLIDRYLPGVEADYILSDNIEGGYQATTHLIEQGHRRIGYISELGCSTINDRLLGYRKALTEHGIEFDETLIYKCDKIMEAAGRLGMEYFLSMQHNRPTAIFATNDIVAKGAFEILKNAGLSVPEDFALVGYDDLDFVNILDVPLTTVAQPGYQIGQEAAKLLMNKIKGNSKNFQKIVLKSKLMIRNSSVFRNSQKNSSAGLFAKD